MERNPTKNHHRNSLQAARIPLPAFPHLFHPTGASQRSPAVRGRPLAPSQSVISDTTWILFLPALPGATELPGLSVGRGPGSPRMALAPGLGLRGEDGILDIGDPDRIPVSKPHAPPLAGHQARLFPSICVRHLWGNPLLTGLRTTACRHWEQPGLHSWQLWRHPLG